MLNGISFSHARPDDFLAAGEFVDFDHSGIQALARDLKAGATDTEDYARRAFAWVRDNIRHSYDFNDEQVSIRASDALLNGTGLCYAKAHLLAALLRLQQIPTGLCYQRLTEGNGHVVHGLVAIWLRDGWKRQDPRGSTNGTTAEFNLDREQLAWHADESLGEVDYPWLFSEPAPQVVAALQHAPSISQAELPNALSEP